MQDLKVKKIVITKPGERHYFQMNLPRYAESIIGVETGITIHTLVMVPPTFQSERLTIKRKRLCGELQLQTGDLANFFYTQEIVQEELNDSVMPFSHPDYNGNLQHPTTPPAVLSDWVSKSFSAGRGKEPDPITIKDEKVIYGCYTDILGRTQTGNCTYTLMLYVWYEYQD